MQYLMTQEEMDANSARLKATELLPSVQALQNFCSFVADNLILTEGSANGRVWGCILTIGPRHYCDECPSKHICPHLAKEWSK